MKWWILLQGAPDRAAQSAKLLKWWILLQGYPLPHFFTSIRMIQETGLINEISRQKNRQIARTLDDLKGLNLPKLIEDRIKQGFYDFESNLLEFIQETQNVTPAK